MSHMLKSSNPEAAEVLEGNYPIVPAGLPVRYRTRAGQMRAGRTEFFAIVTKQNSDGTVDLMVLMEPEDVVEQRHVSRISDHQVDHVWEPMVPSIEDMAEFFERVRSMVFGPFKDPEMSMMEFLEKIDQRLTALEKKGK